MKGLRVDRGQIGLEGLGQTPLALQAAGLEEERFGRASGGRVEVERSVEIARRRVGLIDELVAEPDRQWSAGGNPRQRDILFPGDFRLQSEAFPEEFSAVGRNGQILGHGAERKETEGEHIARARLAEHGHGRGLGHGTDAAVGEPLFRPAVGRARGEIPMVGLVEEPPGLGLRILPVLVGQEIDPDLAGPR